MRDMGEPVVTRLSPTISTLRALFSRSGNRCAFPDCTHILVDEEDLFVGQVCHIEAAEPGGPRYNPSQSDEGRRSAANLILLCYAHHRKTDDRVRFSTATLLQMKKSHEEDFRTRLFTPTPTTLASIAREVEDYWESIQTLSRIGTPSRVFPMAIDTSLKHDGVLQEIHSALRSLCAVVDGLHDGGPVNGWELYHIGVPNWFTRRSLSRGS